jgi:hypothetical protein
VPELLKKFKVQEKMLYNAPIITMHREDGSESLIAVYVGTLEGWATDAKYSEGGDFIQPGSCRVSIGL